MFSSCFIAVLESGYTGIGQLLPKNMIILHLKYDMHFLEMLFGKDKLKETMYILLFCILIYTEVVFKSHFLSAPSFDITIPISF